MKMRRIKSSPFTSTLDKETSQVLRKAGLLLPISIGVASFVLLLHLYSRQPLTYTLLSQQQQQLNPKTLPITQDNDDEDDGSCDLFEGRWIPEPRYPLYSNTSCKTVPESKNCGKHGRLDADYMKWRWKPNDCELPQFDPNAFLYILRGKKLAFIGDSVARNQMESLLCLLSQVETPSEVFKANEGRFHTWYFPSHDFTLSVIWTKFLVVGIERLINGSDSGVFDIHIDKIDMEWAQKLPEIDYAIISDGHWFFRKSYIYESNNLVGCVFCSSTTDPNITNLGLGFAFQKVFQTALEFVNSCEECKGLTTIVRTFSPAHFEHGTWNGGGDCNRTMPLREGEVNFGGIEWEIRNIQLEEVKRVKNKGRMRRFGVLDVTKAMLMRPDGHPGSHWNNNWMKGYNDCVHWCLPGPIDAWNDLLLMVLEKDSSLPSA